MPVIKLKPDSKHKTLIEAYRDGVAEAFNSLVGLGGFDRESSMVMVGYLSAAVVAFRLTGNETAAKQFVQVAARIHNDWRLLEEEVHALCTWLDEYKKGL